MKGSKTQALFIRASASAAWRSEGFIKEQACQKVLSEAGDIVKTFVDVHWDGHDYEISEEKLTDYCIQEMVDRAYTFGRSGGDLERYLFILLLPLAKHDITISPDAEWPQIENELAAAAQEFAVMPVEAKVLAVLPYNEKGSRLLVSRGQARA